MEQIRLTMQLAFDLGPRLVIIQAGRIPASPLPTGGEGPGVRGSNTQVLGVLPPHPQPLSLGGERGENLMTESLESLGRHGDRTGVMIALDTGLDSPETMMAFLARFDVGSLAVNFNPANLVISGHNPYDAVRTFNKRMVHAHAQDARRTSPNRMATVPLGHGDLDWMQLLANFEEVDYRGGLTVLGDDHADVAAGVSFLRRFVA